MMAKISYRHLRQATDEDELDRAPTGRESAVKTADKLHDFLMNPKSRPDLQTPENQDFLKYLESLHHAQKADALMPWLVREWKKGRIHWDDRWRLDQQRGAMGRQHRLTALGDPDPNNWNREREYGERGMVEHSLGHWADFMNSNHPLKREMGDIMQHRIGPFIERVRAWDDDLKNKGMEKELAGGEKVHEWPDGWAIKRLHTPEELRAEGDSMGHCVGGYHNAVANGNTSIYSLRDPKGIPHVTTEIEPKYVLDEAGHRHRKEHLEGPFSSREMSPEEGRIIQIQGKANREPNDEYKQRMREWFETFEKKPSMDAEEWPIITPDEIEDFHLNPTGINEYGLPSRPEVDWEKMMEGHDDPYYTERIFELAKNRREIPEAGHALQGALEYTFKDYDDLEEKNLHWHHDYAGPHPEFIEDPEEAQDHGYPAAWQEMTPQQQDEAMKIYEEREEDASNQLYKEWAKENAYYGPQMELHDKFSPWRDKAGNYNQTPGYAFSSWRI